MDEDIHHKEVGVYGSLDAGFHYGVYEGLIRRLQAFRGNISIIVAAAVYIQDGSLVRVADVLDKADFVPPSWYEAEDRQGFICDGTDALPLWVEENKERIISAASSPLARSLAGLED